MKIEALVKTLFEKWDKSDFMNIPVAENFTHTSPYGVISGKKEYLAIVEANKEKFLGHSFTLHDKIFDEAKACVRYTGTKGDVSLEVSEWYFVKDGLKEKIISYYNIEGEISKERKLERQ